MSKTLEDEFEQLLHDAYLTAFGKVPSDAHAQCMAMRAGSTGEVETLDAAGEAIGLTRERVRQIMVRVTPFLEGRSLPLLEQVAAELHRASPVAEPIGTFLAGLGLTRETLTGGALLNMMKMLGTTPRELIGTDLVPVDGWMVEEGEVPVMGALRVARKHTSAYGMTTVEEIRQELATPEQPLDPTDIERVLRRELSVRWHDGWLWIEKESDGLHSNRLINASRSVLSVNSPQTVASIHEGCRRMWKFRKIDILPPVEAMRGFFERSDHFVVDGELVWPSEALDYHSVLGEVSASVVDVLKETPNEVLDRQSFYDACLDAGINRNTLSIWTSYAEWLESYAPSVWGLRGARPSPAAVIACQESARVRRKSEPHRRDWAWSPDGHIIFTADVTTSLVNSGVVSFGSTLHRTLAGKQLVVYVGADVVATAKIGLEHAFCWGWFPALAALDIKQGDVLEINIDPTALTASLTRGGEELWE